MKRKKPARTRRRIHERPRPMGQTIEESYREPAEGGRETLQRCRWCGTETLAEESVACPTCGKTSA